MARVNFTNANLTGAIFTGAHVYAPIWNHTMCPDGTNSNNDGGTCKGHLGPVAGQTSRGASLTDRATGHRSRRPVH
ncbi:MAG: pentapeptide repeat-containing protein [Acidimicrobiales bacterium]